MATPSGQISLSQVNTELGFSSTAVITMNDAAVRSLAGVPTGAITMANLQNKSNTFNATISSPQTNLDLITYLTPLGYTPGSNASITIAPGVTISATTTGNTGLTIPSAFGAGKLTLTNNGQIFGKGGVGGSAAGVAPAVAPGPGGAGGAGMSIGTPIFLTNNSFIAGGGGGGTGIQAASPAGGGGGGAGGGAGGTSTTPNPLGVAAGGAGGTTFPGSGGGGVPSAQAAPRGGNAGGAGGSGGCSVTQAAVPTPVGPGLRMWQGIGGGGGGWGAAGGGAKFGIATNAPFIGTSGAGGSSNAAGGDATIPGPVTITTYGSTGSAGKAINLNGNVITYLATGTIWGGVS